MFKTQQVGQHTKGFSLRKHLANSYSVQIFVRIIICTGSESIGFYRDRKSSGVSEWRRIVQASDRGADGCCRDAKLSWAYRYNDMLNQHNLLINRFYTA